MNEVEPGLYLSGERAASNKELLSSCGITHVLNCVGFTAKDHFSSTLQYRTYCLRDTPGEDIMAVLYDALDFIHEALRDGGRVLVHCSQGVSRSATLVIAYLMWRSGKSYSEVYGHVKGARAVASPNIGFTCQLLQWQKRRQLPAPMRTRLYRLAPHTPSTPTTLVARLLPLPKEYGQHTFSQLDARGAFVVHHPERIYIWVGAYCPPLLAATARHHARLLLKYEHPELAARWHGIAQAPVLEVRQGSEPLCLLDLLDPPRLNAEAARAQARRISIAEELAAPSLSCVPASEGGADSTLLDSLDSIMQLHPHVGGPMSSPCVGGGGTSAMVMGETMDGGGGSAGAQKCLALSDDLEATLLACGSNACARALHLSAGGAAECSGSGGAQPPSLMSLYSPCTTQQQQQQQQQPDVTRVPWVVGVVDEYTADYRVLSDASGITTLMAVHAPPHGGGSVSAGGAAIGHQSAAGAMVAARAREGRGCEQLRGVIDAAAAQQQQQQCGGLGHHSGVCVGSAGQDPVPSDGAHRATSMCNDDGAPSPRALSHSSSDGDSSASMAGSLDQQLEPQQQQQQQQKKYSSFDGAATAPSPSPRKLRHSANGASPRPSPRPSAATLSELEPQQQALGISLSGAAMAPSPRAMFHSASGASMATSLELHLLGPLGPQQPQPQHQQGHGSSYRRPYGRSVTSLEASMISRQGAAGTGHWQPTPPRAPAPAAPRPTGKQWGADFAVGLGTPGIPLRFTLGSGCGGGEWSPCGDAVESPSNRDGSPNKRNRRSDGEDQTGCASGADSGLVSKGSLGSMGMDMGSMGSRGGIRSLGGSACEGSPTRGFGSGRGRTLPVLHISIGDDEMMA
ncbi:hypothetical protein FOA52_012347 [Chlamydomonas sp. UWO 241]|nr:hypothetical protein FOA52_012347 [Chlamydomonas sp. UWO 241]